MTGASGFLGAYVLDALAGPAPVFTVGRSVPRSSSSHVWGDLRDDAVHREIRARAPAAVVHAAAVSDPDRCEREPELARAVNVEASARLARAVAGSCRRFLYVSTDLVFDGREGGYAEDAAPRPLSAYGRTKLEGESAVADALGERASVVRVALLYGARRGGVERPSFAEATAARARSGEPVDLFTDQFRSPLHAEDAALGLRRLLYIPEAPPVVHLGGPERLSRFEMGTLVLRVSGSPNRSRGPAG